MRRRTAVALGVATVALVGSGVATVQVVRARELAADGVPATVVVHPAVVHPAASTAVTSRGARRTVKPLSR